MRHLARYTLSALTALSLLLALGTMGLWVRSYFATDWLSWATVRVWHPPLQESDNVHVISSRGSISIGRGRAAGPIGVEEGFKWWRLNASAWRGQAGSFWNRLGFGYHHGNPSEPSVERVRELMAVGNAVIWGDWDLAMPHWLLLLLLIALPLYRQPDARKRRGAWVCARCGRDLRATPDRCPECGTMPDEPHASHRTMR